MFRVDLAVGLAIDGDVSPDVVVLKDYDVPIPLCNFNMTFAIPGLLL